MTKFVAILLAIVLMVLAEETIADECGQLLAKYPVYSSNSDKLKKQEFEIVSRYGTILQNYLALESYVLQKNEDIDEKNDEYYRDIGSTLLAVAVVQKELSLDLRKIIKYLLSRNVDPTEKDYTGVSPLSLTILLDRTEIMDELISSSSAESLTKLALNYEELMSYADCVGAEEILSKSTQLESILEMKLRGQSKVPK